MYPFFSVPSDVSCQIRGARGDSLSVGGVKPENLFLGNDIRKSVSKTSIILCCSFIHFCINSFAYILYKYYIFNSI